MKGNQNHDLSRSHSRSQGRTGILRLENLLHETCHHRERMNSSDIQLEAKDFLHDCDRSARYHMARMAYFDFWNKVILVSVIFINSSAVVLFVADIDKLGSSGLISGLMLIPAFLVSISVVLNLNNKARDHQFLARQFYEMAASIDVDKANQENVQIWYKAIIKLYATEPAAVYHALNAECSNAASQALGYGKEKFQRVVWWQYMFRNWCRFSAEDFPRIKSA